MRPAAKVGPFALAVELHLLVGGNGVDQLDLECFAFLLEEAFRLPARDDGLPKRFVAGDDLTHALLDRREILGRERLGTIEVVVEAVLDDRSNGDLRSRPKRLYRLGEHMRRIVTDQREGPWIVAGDELERRVLIDRVGKINKLAVANGGHRALGERGRNGLGDVEARNAWLVGALSAVGEGDANHKSSSSSLADTSRRKRSRDGI